MKRATNERSFLLLRTPEESQLERSELANTWSLVDEGSPGSSLTSTISADKHRNSSGGFIQETFKISLGPPFFVIPPCEHMCVFQSQTDEQQNRDEGFEQPESTRASGGAGGPNPACRLEESTVRSGDEVGPTAIDRGVTEKRGAAVWAGIHIPVVQPDGWPVYHLQMGLRQLERLRRENEAAMALLVGAMPESRDTVADIARNSGVSNREARRRKSVADVCGKIKGALEKLKSGAISNEHVSALAPVADMPGAASLLDDAESKSPEELTRDVEEFRLSSAYGNDMAKRQRARRYLRFFAGPEGTIGINGLLPPVEGTELKNRLAAIVDAQWRKDHPERAKVLGGHADDAYDQRMADALIAMAGVQSQATSTSTGPDEQSPVKNTAPQDQTPTDPLLATTGIHSHARSTSSSAHGASPVKNQAAQNQETTDPPLATTGVCSKATSTSTRPDCAHPAANTATQNQGTTDPLLAMTGVRSEATSTSSHPHNATRVGNAVVEDLSAPTTGGSSGSSQTPIEPEAKDIPSAEKLPRANRPTEALPMKAGLRLVGLASLPGTPGRSQPAPGLAGDVPERVGADPHNDAIRALVPRNQKSLGTSVKTGKPAVVIVFDVDRWKARIAGGGPIPITESLLDQARNDLYYCFENTVGEVIKFARSRRDPTPIQKLVLVVRDEKCLYPGCYAPPDACDAHHLNEVVKDKGRTDTDVMGLFCEAHHRHIHLNDLVVKRNPDGSITIIERRTGTVVAVVASRHPRKEAA